MANSLRSSDTASEKAVAEFLERHFYPKHVTNLTRFTDFETQMQGIDVQFDYMDNTGMLVDEKTAAHYVNKDLPTFAFEVNFLLTNNQLVNGWLYDDNKKTQYYLLSWIKAKKDKGFNVDDITQLEILLIERKKIVKLLESYGLTKQTAETKAHELRLKGIQGVSEKVIEKPFYFYYSTHLIEKPVNIIIKKDMLIKLSLSRFIINK